MKQKTLDMSDITSELESSDLDGEEKKQTQEEESKAKLISSESNDLEIRHKGSLARVGRVAVRAVKKFVAPL